MLPCHFASNSFVNCPHPATYMVESYWGTPGPKPLCAKHTRTHSIRNRPLTPAERKMIPGRVAA